MIPYSKQTIEKADREALLDVLKSDWLTTGPKVEQFETKLAEKVRVDHVIAVNSGTAALHSMLKCSGIREGDEVIVPALSFVATANAILYCGAKPVFADIDPETFLICPESVKSLVSRKTRAILAVDFGGQPCDYEQLRGIASNKDCYLFSDSSHSLGATWKTQAVAELCDATIFSFHPVKPITTGEGGAVATDHPLLMQRIKRFRNHGVTVDHSERREKGTWHYDVRDLGYNYRISDLQCALGIAQLDRLDQWHKRRNQIAAIYSNSLARCPNIQIQAKSPLCSHAYHLFTVCLDSAEERERAFNKLREDGVGVNVHYRPIYQHSLYRELGYADGLCPNTESVASRILSLPIYPTMSEEDIQHVISSLGVAAPNARVAA